MIVLGTFMGSGLSFTFLGGVKLHILKFYGISFTILGTSRT